MQANAKIKIDYPLWIVHSSMKTMLIRLCLPLVLAFVLLGCFLPSYANAPISTTQHLSNMEQQLFSRTYDTESPENRLNRIENAVLGSTHTDQPIDARIQSLDQVFQASTVNHSDTAQNPPTQYQQNSQQAQNGPSESQQEDDATANAKDATQYPTVTEMEKRVLHQSFENDPLNNRLGRLETQVFGHPQNGSLEDRTDHLTSVVLGNNPNNAQADGSNNQVADASGSSGPGNSSNNASMSNSDMQQALPIVEKKILHQTYPQDTVDNRLNRLEMKVFNATATDMAPEDRLYRIVSVVNAHASPRQDQAGGYGYGGGPGYGTGRPAISGTAAGTIGTMLLMILMSFL